MAQAQETVGLFLSLDHSGAALYQTLRLIFRVYCRNSTPRFNRVRGMVFIMNNTSPQGVGDTHGGEPLAGGSSAGEPSAGEPSAGASSAGGSSVSTPSSTCTPSSSIKSTSASAAFLPHSDDGTNSRAGSRPDPLLSGDHVSSLSSKTSAQDGANKLKEARYYLDYCKTLRVVTCQVCNRILLPKSIDQHLAKVHSMKQPERRDLAKIVESLLPKPHKEYSQIVFPSEPILPIPGLKIEKRFVRCVFPLPGGSGHVCGKMFGGKDTQPTGKGKLDFADLHVRNEHLHIGPKEDREQVRRYLKINVSGQRLISATSHSSNDIYTERPLGFKPTVVSAFPVIDPDAEESSREESQDAEDQRVRDAMTRSNKERADVMPQHTPGQTSGFYLNTGLMKGVEGSNRSQWLALKASASKTNPTEMMLTAAVKSMARTYQRTVAGTSSFVLVRIMHEDSRHQSLEKCLARPLKAYQNSDAQHIDPLVKIFLAILRHQRGTRKFPTAFALKEQQFEAWKNLDKYLESHVGKDVEMQCGEVGQMHELEKLCHLLWMTMVSLILQS